MGWSDSDKLWGWTVGVGYEYAFAKSWRVRLEYQYIDLGSAESLMTDGSAYDQHRATDITLQSWRGALSFTF